MARVIREVRQRRGCFGTAFLVVFWLWNAFMLWALFSGLANVSNPNSYDSAAERAGAAIGTTIGVTMILVIWGAGTLILGLMVLLTRGRTEIVEHAPAAVARADDPALLETSGSYNRRAEPQLIAGSARSSRPIQLAQAPRGRSVAIVGESLYQPTIDAAMRDSEEVDGVYIVGLTIEAEPGNPHDPDAVRVAWRGHTVGYLPRKRTADWHSTMGQSIGACSGAIIYGGFDEGEAEGREPMAGIWLNVNWPPRPA